jgi:hypothetical protein
MIPLRSLILSSCLGFALSTVASVPAAETNGTATNSTNAPCFQLSVELKDGSRIKGKSLEDPLRFRSAALGAIKLPVADIRSLELSDKGEEVRLSATNGDVINLQIQMTALNLETCFGKAQLPINLVRKVDVSMIGNTGDHPLGLVALWAGKGQGNDSVGNHNAAGLEGVSFVPGKLGMAFNLSGNDSGIVIPASPDLNVGMGSGFTLSCWIKPKTATFHQPLMEWRKSSGGPNPGVHFWINQQCNGMGGPGGIFANVGDVNGDIHIIVSSPGIIQPGVFQFVALTYDKQSGMAKLYYNGAIVASQNLGNFTPQTSADLLLGERIDADNVHYQGLLDEVSVYNHALSAEEIQKIYVSAPAGDASVMASGMRSN